MIWPLVFWACGSPGDDNPDYDWDDLRASCAVEVEPVFADISTTYSTCDEPSPPMATLDTAWVPVAVCEYVFCGGGVRVYDTRRGHPEIRYYAPDGERIATYWTSYDAPCESGWVLEYSRSRVLALFDYRDDPELDGLCSSRLMR